MNALSWLLYWADVLPSLATFTCILASVTFCTGVFLTGCGIAGQADVAIIDAYAAELAIWEKTEGKTYYNKPERPRDSQVREASRNRKLRFAPYLAVVAFLAWSGAFLVPGKDTFYLIAASEAGEVALQAPEAAKVRAVINKWLDEQAGPAEQAN